MPRPADLAKLQARHPPKAGYNRAMKSPASHLPIAAAFASLVSVQIGAAFAKTIFAQVGTEGMASLRLGFAALLLGLFLSPWKLRPGRQGWGVLLAYGAILALMNTLIYRAFAHIPVGIAISIEVLGPLAAALFASRRRLDLLWIALAVTGLALLPFGLLNTAIDPLGVLFSLLAALFWGLYLVVGSRMVPFGGRGVALGMALAALMVVPLGIHQAGTNLLSPQALTIGLTVASLSSALPFLLDLYAMKHLHRSVFGVLMSASPAVSALAGQIILQERLSLPQWLGITAITAACLGSALISARARRMGTQQV